jgi:hypothetical protein
LPILPEIETERRVSMEHAACRPYSLTIRERSLSKHAFVIGKKNP